MIRLDGDAASLFDGAARSALENDALPRFLSAQRWFGGKARHIATLRLGERATLRGGAAPAWLQLVNVEYADGSQDTYFVPLAVVAEDAPNVAPEYVLTRLSGPHGRAALIDALADADCCRLLLDAIAEQAEWALGDGVIRGVTTAAFAQVRGTALPPLAVRLGPATSSNTLVFFGDRLLLKLFRRLESGLNPDFEMGRFLTETGRFERTPKLAGALLNERPGGVTTLALAQQLVPNEASGWEHAQGELRSFFAQAAELAMVPRADGRSLMELAGTAAPAWVAELAGNFLPEATLLGRRTAELHRALASAPDDPAFAPEPLTAADLAALDGSVQAEARQALDLLGAAMDRLPAALASDARRLLERAPAALRRLDESSAGTTAQKLRCHGDYHLGQVLWAEGDFWIIDFEGEPTRTVAERRLKQSPLRDVAGLLRSLDYAAHAGLLVWTQTHPDDGVRLAAWAGIWQRWTSAAFLRQYRTSTAGAAFLPADADALTALLDRFLLEKAFYELAYELNNRPEWVRIPLRGLLTLLDGRAAESSRRSPNLGEPRGSDRLDRDSGKETFPVATAVSSTAPFLTDFDLYLFSEGTFYRSYEKLGAHVIERDGTVGTHFAVWAPNAREVAVIGDFNGWNDRANFLHPQASTGLWAGFIPGVTAGTLYKYAISSQYHGYRVVKSDPYAFAFEMRPQTASKVWNVDGYAWGDGEWMAQRKRTNAYDAPLAIYEVHLGSWMRNPDEGNRWLTYHELADRLADYVASMGYTHVQFLPVSEHPLDASWGYQPAGYFAPTSRFGTPQDFMYLVDRLHQRGIGVLLDWVPAHFPRDEHGLGYFDGTHLYEHADPRMGQHQDWGTFIFNYGRREVVNFLISNALFWLDKYHIDGLRVDAVASMLYLDYSRKEGEWIPNRYGGRENLDAIDFLRRFNERVYSEFPDVMTVAEESTAWGGVSRPTYTGGLGFGYKWDMGWMHDTLKYIEHDPIHRKYHHNQLTFRMLYAFTENYILPLSHDEVVHGKRAILSKMPGDDWQKFANTRLLYGYMYTQAGKKLLFMGGEFGQWDEWNHDKSLDWHLLQWPPHQGLQRWVRDLNTFYRGEPALHQLDCDPAGYEWIDANDWEGSVLAYLRRGKDPNDPLLVVCNFTPVPRHNYRVGVPHRGYWQEVLNSDAPIYGGSGQGNLGGAETAPMPMHGRPYLLNLTLPPLGMVVFKRKP